MINKDHLWIDIILDHDYPLNEVAQKLGYDPDTFFIGTDFRCADLSDEDISSVYLDQSDLQKAKLPPDYEIPHVEPVMIWVTMEIEEDVGNLDSGCDITLHVSGASASDILTEVHTLHTKSGNSAAIDQEGIKSSLTEGGDFLLRLPWDVKNSSYEGDQDKMGNMARFADGTLIDELYHIQYHTIFGVLTVEGYVPWYK